MPEPLSLQHRIRDMKTAYGVLLGLLLSFAANS